VRKAHTPYWNSTAPSASPLVVRDNAVPHTDVTSYDSAGRSVASIYQKNGSEKWRTTTRYDGDRVTIIPPTGATTTTTVTNGPGEPSAHWTRRALPTPLAAALSAAAPSAPAAPP
jgi:hypothetical protein